VGLHLATVPQNSTVELQKSPVISQKVGLPGNFYQIAQGLRKKSLPSFFSDIFQMKGDG
jgi:hypothetical protein